MATKSVLIIGGSGYLGTHLALSLRDDYKVFATFHRHRINLPGITSVPLSLFNRDWAKRIVYLARPDFVIYAAGSNNVSVCEADARLTEQVHTSGAATLSNLSEIFQPTFIYLSNDYVFDGMKGNYHETDIVLPSTALGKAKVGGENFIRNKSLSYTIVRSAPLLGRGNGINLSFFDRLRINLSKGQRLELPDDEIHNYAPVHGFVELIQRILHTNTKKRIFHYGGLVKVTPYELGVLFAKRFRFDPALLAPIKSKIHHGGSQHQNLDYSLNCSAATDTLKIKPFFLEECFDLIEKNLIASP